jgi:hypothetical protein
MRHCFTSGYQLFQNAIPHPWCEMHEAATTLLFETFSVSGTNPQTKELDGFRAWRSMQTHECSLAHTNTLNLLGAVHSYLPSDIQETTYVPHMRSESLITNSTINL